MTTRDLNAMRREITRLASLEATYTTERHGSNDGQRAMREWARSQRLALEARLEGLQSEFRSRFATGPTLFEVIQ